VVGQAVVNVELFGCSGGMALGFRRAGVEFDMVIDADPHAVASYEANLGHRPTQVDVRDFLRSLQDGWRPAERVGLLVADPPCTPWSRAGKRKGQADERDMLATTMGVIELLLPECWMIANVPGLDDSSHWDSVVKPVIGETAARLGYCVDYASLNAANYGVPQTRVRPFWFAHKIGTECIRWPAPTHGDPARMATLPLPGIEPLEPWVTCRDALRHLSLEELGTPVRLRWRNPDARASRTDKPARTQLGSRPGIQSPSLLVVHPKHPPSDLDAPARTQIHGNGTSPPCAILSVGDGPRAMMRPHEPDRPARTLTGNRQDSTHVLAVSRRHASHDDRPARTQVALPNDGAVLAMSRDLHPPSDVDKPAQTITQESHHRPDGVLSESRRVGQWPSKGSHMPSRADEPALVQTSATGATSGVMEESRQADGKWPVSRATEPARLQASSSSVASSVLAEAADEWPWARPSTTVTKDDRISPPGHHDGGSYMSRGVKLSEKARLVLQSFPEDWQLLSPTKTGRSSMLGQAMPPGLAEPVARAVRAQMETD
jgi:site-specific DNA-cytosine methylase